MSTSPSASQAGIGTYNDEEGQSSCKACGLGQYNYKDGSTTEAACKEKEAKGKEGAVSSAKRAQNVGLLGVITMAISCWLSVAYQGELFDGRRHPFTS